MGNLDIKIRRAKSYPHCGRLIVLESVDSYQPLQPFTLENNFSIDFPAMPEVIELARQTDYKVINNMVIPDGVHQYRFTSPLIIPFSFVLHSMDDEYCPDGSLTLMRVAARLHALTLPFGDSSSTTVSVSNDSPLADGKPDQGAKAPGSEQPAQARSQEPNDPSFQAATNAKFDPPVTCRLELMFTEESEPGIICTGYVKDVVAKLKGPWLRGPGRAFNLPSSGEFSFNFVHRPAHYNSYSGKTSNSQSVGQSQAFAKYVLGKLYNTRELSTTGDYRGFNS